MSIVIENVYKTPISEDFNEIINDVVEESIEYVNCPFECEVNVLFVDDESIKEINVSHRGINSSTDVLSFPFVEYKEPGDFSFLENDDVTNGCFNPETGELLLGDIVISFDKAIEQAKEYNHSIYREIAFLTAHSMLHLFGYDHINDHDIIEMERMQEEILNKRGYTRDYEKE